MNMEPISHDVPGPPRRIRRRPAGDPNAGPRQTRDAEVTRRAILDAAVIEFAHVGLGGARVELISQRAGCNLRMIYYYFGSKEALYVAALEKVYADFVAAEHALDLDSIDPCEGVRHVISFTWHYFREHPEFISLLNTENMHQARFAKSSPAIAGNATPQMQLIDRLLRRGIEDGSFRRDVSVFETHVTITSLCYFYLSNRSTMSNYLGRDMSSQAACDSWLAHVSRVVLNSLVDR